MFRGVPGENEFDCALIIRRIPVRRYQLIRRVFARRIAQTANVLYRESKEGME